MELVIRLLADAVVPLFFAGVAGSLAVIAVSIVGDLKEIFEDED